LRYEPQHADERHGVAGADQDPGRHRAGDVVRERHQRLSGRHHERARDHQPQRPEPVQQQADRHLQARVHQKLQDREQRQRAGVIPNRCCASRPATPRDVRCRTPTM
jgi:hypothetical protein